MIGIANGTYGRHEGQFPPHRLNARYSLR